LRGIQDRLGKPSRIKKIVHQKILIGEKIIDRPVWRRDAEISTANKNAEAQAPEFLFAVELIGKFCSFRWIGFVDSHPFHQEREMDGARSFQPASVKIL
jgi:hypothetical protein